MAIKRRTKVTATYNMSSLTDIVFLLLIFFMLTSSFVTPNALDLLLPQSSSSSVSKQTVTVSINKDLEYYVGKNQVEFKNLQKQIAKRISQKKGETVVLAADKTVPVSEIVKVLNIGNEIEARVILATEPEE
jgi:biopolymer transport protein ExbD